MSARHKVILLQDELPSQLLIAIYRLIYLDYQHFDKIKLRKLHHSVTSKT
jgi:hypothetical protein